MMEQAINCPLFPGLFDKYLTGPDFNGTLMIFVSKFRTWPIPLLLQFHQMFLYPAHRIIIKYLRKVGGFAAYPVSNNRLNDLLNVLHNRHDVLTSVEHVNITIARHNLPNSDANKKAIFFFSN